METSFFTRIKGFKTLGINLLVMFTGLLTALGIIDQGLPAAALEEGVNQLLGGAEMALGGVNIFLRMVTNTGILKNV